MPIGTPYKYYRLLRRFGYRPRTAMSSVLMRFCRSKDEYAVRANRIAKVLNRFDKGS